jgi:hypothetical protein
MKHDLLARLKVNKLDLAIFFGMVLYSLYIISSYLEKIA